MAATQRNGNVGPGLVGRRDDLLDDRSDRFGSLVVEFAQIFLVELQKGDDPVGDVLLDHCVAVVQILAPGWEVADDLGRLDSATGSLVIELVV